jgi:hypothetical protein
MDLARHPSWIIILGEVCLSLLSCGGGHENAQIARGHLQIFKLTSKMHLEIYRKEG